MTTTLTSRNPWTGAKVATVHRVDAAGCAEAMRTAAAAADPWRRTPRATRQALVTQARRIIEAQRNHLAGLIRQETGKPQWEALAEVGAVIAKLDRTLAADERWSQAMGCPPRPLGPGVILGPFNLPAHLTNGWLVASLLAGNPVIVKPSEHCPAVGDALVGAYHAAGIPSSVLQVVHGDRTTAAHLLSDPRLAAVWFTGSRRGGVAIHQQLAGRPEVLLALEMGGNNPLVVWDGDNPDAIARLIIRSAFITAGQRCVCARRLILPATSFGEAVLTALNQAVDHLIIGDPNGEPQPFLGPVITPRAASAVIDRHQQLQQQGGDTLRTPTIHPDHPALVTPGLIQMPQQWRDDDLECFGPLLIIQRATTSDQALSMATATGYGLAAGLISTDDELWQAFQDRVPAGVLNRNRPITGASGDLPFGGLGKSGNHHPGGAAAIWSCQDPIALGATSQVGDEPITHGWRP